MTMPASAAATAPSPRRAAMSVVPEAIDTGGNVLGPLPSLGFGLDDLARAMYCVGRINYRRGRRGLALPHRYGPSASASVNVQLASLLKREWVSRLELVHAYCAPQSASIPPGRQLVLSEIVSMLDSSEKGSFAYFLGQAFTWMYCQSPTARTSARIGRTGPTDGAAARTVSVGRHADTDDARPCLPAAVLDLHAEPLLDNVPSGSRRVPAAGAWPPIPHIRGHSSVGISQRPEGSFMLF